MEQWAILLAGLAVLVSMATIFKSLKFYIKLVAYALAICGCAIYGVVALIVLRLLGKPQYAQYTTARAFYYVCSLIFGIKIVVKNEQYLKLNPAVYISNHQSALDVVVLGRVFQPGMLMTAKSSLRFVPFLGWFMMLSGTFFLNRQKLERARKVLTGALFQLKEQNRGLYIFPEGTRSGFQNLDMLPFKKGAFHLAKQAGIPVVPIVVSNTLTIFSPKTKTFESGVIEIEVLPPVPMANVETNEEVTEVCNKVHDDMVTCLKTRVGYSIAPTDGSQSIKDLKDVTDGSVDDKKDANDDVVEVTKVATENTPLVDQ